MAARRPVRRSVKLPPPTEVDQALVDAFMDSIGWDADARKRVTSVRINASRVEVDTRPKPDVRVTVVHPVVWPDPED